MAFRYEINGQLVDFEREPSEADINEAATSLGNQPSQTQQPQEMFTQAKFDPIESNLPSPLNLGQNFVLGFAPTTDGGATQMRYLAKEFEGKEVKQDPEGNILVNGARVNPAGFDFGDIVRGAGSALPFVGYVLGASAGAAAGTPTGPGAALLAASSGIQGAVAGEALKLSAGKAFGLDPEFDDAVKSLAMEGVYSTGGEIGGRLIGKGARAFAKTPIGKSANSGFTKAWGYVTKNAKKMTPKIAEFVAGVDKQAAEFGPTHNVPYRDFLNDEYFKPTKITQIGKRTLFGSELIPDEEIGVPRAGLNGVRNGTVALVDSINAVKNQEFSQYIQSLTGLSDKTLNTIRTSSRLRILNRSTTNEAAAFNLAKSLDKRVTSHLGVLGKRIASAENEALKSFPKTATFDTAEVARDLDELIKGTGLTQKIKVGGLTQKDISFNGSKELLNMRELLGGRTPKGEFALFGSKERPKLPSMKQAVIISKKMETLADNFFLNQSVPESARAAGSEFMARFRSKIHSRLGLGQLKEDYSLFKDLANKAKIGYGKHLAEMEGTIKNFGSQLHDTKNNVRKILEALPNEQGNPLLKRVSYINAAEELKSINPDQVLKKVESQIGNKQILSSNLENSLEGRLNSLSSFLEKGNPESKKRAFYLDAQKALAARGFLDGAPNMLRVLSVARLLGLAGAGAFLGSALGPVGSIAGAGATLAVSSPQNVAKALVALEKSLSPSTKAALLRQVQKTGSKVIPYQKALLAELLQQNFQK